MEGRRGIGHWQYCILALLCSCLTCREEHSLQKSRQTSELLQIKNVGIGCDPQFLRLQTFWEVASYADVGIRGCILCIDAC